MNFSKLHPTAVCKVQVTEQAYNRYFLKKKKYGKGEIG